MEATKQTSVDLKAPDEVKNVPHMRVADPDRGPVHALQPEGEGVEALMDPLHEKDPVARRRGVADAERDTAVDYAKTTAEAMKK